MNKSSRLLWFLVLAVVFVLGWRIIHKPRPYVLDERTLDIFGGIKSTLGMFSVDCGRYPTTAEGLQALITCPTDISPKIWKGPYLDSPKFLRDPWGHDFVYRCPGIHNSNAYDLYSKGPDGVTKTGGDDPDDIGNWVKR